MSSARERLAEETSPAALFPLPPSISFRPETVTCPSHGLLRVQKSREKTVQSMAGPFVAHETVMACAHCDRIERSQSLLSLVAPRCNVGYDVLVFVGLALFQRQRTNAEVLEQLRTRNVHLSSGEIDYLGRKFILYLAAAQRRALPRIRQAMSRAGGYILHLDAMHEHNTAALLCGFDAISKFILANIKVTGENAKEIIPFLRQIKTDYGVPAACVHDMGKGLCRAVGVVFPGTPDYICQFHFLRDLGKDFMGSAYDRLRKRLRHHAASTKLCELARRFKGQLADTESGPLAKAILTSTASKDVEALPSACAYALARWALEGKKVGGGYGFPFDRPLLAFAERLLLVHQRLPQFYGVLLRQQWRDNIPLHMLFRRVRKVAEDRPLRQAVTELQWRCALFDELRTAMRMAPMDEADGLNSGDAPVPMATLHKAAMRFRRRLTSDATFAADELCRKMAAQIDQYADQLFAEPIPVDTADGPTLIYPQRTNNDMERIFRDLRRRHRRKTGNSTMARTLQAMLADTPLVRNLDNSDYMTVLLDGRDSLECLFADIDAAELAERLRQQHGPDRTLDGFAPLLHNPNLLDLVAKLFESSPNNLKSN